jgi:hypothetical protein
MVKQGPSFGGGHFPAPFFAASTSSIAVALQQMLVPNDNFIVTFKADQLESFHVSVQKISARKLPCLRLTS